MNSINVNPLIEPSTHAPKPWAFVSLSLIILLSSLGTSSANVALPTFATVFNSSFQAVQWVVIAYLLAITVFVVNMGRMGDLFGRRRLLLGGLLVFILGSAMCALAGTLGLLIFARILQGVGAAAMMALAMAFVNKTVAKEKAGSAMGVLGTVSAIGTALGPSLGGALLASLGWQAIFLVNIPLGILAFSLAYRYLPADRAFNLPISNGSRFDFPGAMLLAATLTLYSLAVTLGHGSFSVVNMALMCCAMVVSAAFVFIESKVPVPLVAISLLRNPALCASLAANALIATVIMTTLVVGPFYLTGALGLNALSLGLVMSSGPIVSALVGVPAGRIIDKYGSYPMIIVGLLVMLLGSFSFVLMPIDSGVFGYLGSLVLMTAGYAIFQVANNTSVMASAADQQNGLVAGLLNLSRNLGLITGASVMGAIFAWGAGESNLVGTHAGSAVAGMRLVFSVATAFIGCALVISRR